MSQPTPPPPSRSWGLTFLTVVVIAVLVAPIVVAAVHWLGSRSDSDDVATDPGAANSPTAATSSSAAPTRSATPSATPTPSTTPTRSSSPAAPSSSAPPPVTAAFSCWDGKPAAKLDSCTEPQGLAGLEWVFPSMAHQQCVQQHTRGGIGRSLLYACLARLDDGTKVLVDYSLWDSNTSAYSHYSQPGLVRTPVLGPEGLPTFYEWLGPANGQNAGIIAYAADPFSVEVYLDDPGRVYDALTHVVEVRPYDQVQGAPTK